MGTVTDGASGGPDTGGASCVPTIPACDAGDGLLLKTGWGNDSMTRPPTPSGWTLVVSGYGGVGAFGNNVGERGVSTFFRESPSSEDGTATLTVNSGDTGNAAITGRIQRYTKDSGTWDVQGFIGTDTSAGTAYSATASADPGLAEGDRYSIVNAYVPRAQSPSSPGASWPGCTVSGAALNGSTANGNGWDVRLVLFDGGWVSGTSTGAPTVTFTTSGSINGGCTAFTRLRAVDASGPTIAVWNGTTEVDADAYIWNGSVEAAIDSLVVS